MDDGAADELLDGFAGSLFVVVGSDGLTVLAVGSAGLIAEGEELLILRQC